MKIYRKQKLYNLFRIIKQAKENGYIYSLRSLKRDYNIDIRNYIDDLKKVFYFKKKNNPYKLKKRYELQLKDNYKDYLKPYLQEYQNLIDKQKKKG